MKNKPRLSRPEISPGTDSSLNDRPVRPPAIPSAELHKVNVTNSGIGSHGLAAWLGVDVAEIENGDNPLVRVACAYYAKHKARVIMARLSVGEKKAR